MAVLPHSPKGVPTTSLLLVGRPLISLGLKITYGVCLPHTQTPMRQEVQTLSMDNSLHESTRALPDLQRLLRPTQLFEYKPFDWHDWYIDNCVNRERRCMFGLFFVGGKPSGCIGTTQAEINVCQVLQFPQAVWRRGQRIAKDLFPGFAKYLENWQPRTSSAVQQQQQRRQHQSTMNPDQEQV
jgi:hypothetical protein